MPDLADRIEQLNSWGFVGGVFSVVFFSEELGVKERNQQIQPLGFGIIARPRVGQSMCRQGMFLSFWDVLPSKGFYVLQSFLSPDVVAFPLLACIGRSAKGPLAWRLDLPHQFAHCSIATVTWSQLSELCFNDQVSMMIGLGRLYISPMFSKNCELHQIYQSDQSEFMRLPWDNCGDSMVLDRRSARKNMATWSVYEEVAMDQKDKPNLPRTTELESILVYQTGVF